MRALAGAILCSVVMVFMFDGYSFSAISDVQEVVDEKRNRLHVETEQGADGKLHQIRLVSADGGILKKFLPEDVVLSKNNDLLLEHLKSNVVVDGTTGEKYIEKTGIIYDLKSGTKWEKAYKTYPDATEDDAKNISWGEEKFSDIGGKLCIGYRDAEGGYCLSVYGSTGTQLAVGCIKNALKNIEMLENGMSVGAWTTKDGKNDSLFVLGVAAGNTFLENVSGKRWGPSPVISLMVGACKIEYVELSVDALAYTWWGPSPSLLPEPMDGYFNYPFFDSFSCTPQDGATECTIKRDAYSTWSEKPGCAVKDYGLQYHHAIIEMFGLSPDLTQEERKSIRLIQYRINGTTADVTSDHFEDHVSGTATSLRDSVFSLVAPISAFDTMGPEGNLLYSSNHSDSEQTYISSTTFIKAVFKDLSSKTYALAGVDRTYCLIDIAPTADCVNTTFLHSAQSGTCANPECPAQFTLAEGEHVLNYGSVDRVGNWGEWGQAPLSVDGTAPISTIKINEAPISDKATGYITTDDVLTFSAYDPISKGVSSGVADYTFLIGISPEECEYSDWSGGVDGVGSCENRHYPGPMKLPKGEYYIFYSAKDNVGNEERLKSIYLVVG